MTTDTLIGAVEKMLPNSDAPELTERVYRQAGLDIIALIRQHTPPARDGREVDAILKHPAYAALRDGQRQLDADGVEVGVSRQAVDEVLAMIAALPTAAGADKAEEWDKVEDMISEFGDDPVECLKIISEHINMARHYKAYPNAAKGE